MKPLTRHRILISLIPITVLVVLLALDVSIFGSDSILGASQVALLVSAGICIWLSMWLFKTPWKEFEEAIASNLGNVTTAIVILFLIGAISGTWTMSGVIPTLIYYGIQIISPKVFLVTACIICAIVSLMIGSSWTTIATIGVALLGIGKALGFSEGLTAGAISSGAYFGDKISPLSDTTVLASSMNGVPLFRHIRNMMFTTVPSMTITLIIFLILGLTHQGVAASQISQYTEALGGKFNISLWLLLVPVFTAWLIARKNPAIVVLGLSAAVAAVTAIFAQPHIIQEIGSKITEGSQAKVLFTGIVQTIYDTVSVQTGNPDVDGLVTSRGMTGMLNTVYLIICARCFGGCMNASSMLRHLASLLIPLCRRRTSMVAGTVTTGTLLNGIVSDQYLSIILTGNLFQGMYNKKGYAPELLSRSIEDSATVTSPLIPWSSCGMTQATILGVATLTYAPFCFFNWISPMMSIFIAAIGFKIPRLPQEAAE